MVRFENRKGTEYVVKQEGEISMDDPVAARLYERMTKALPSTRLRIGKKSRTYTEWLDEFEGGKLTRQDYEELRKKLRLKSITQELDERQSSKILRRDLVKYLYGGIDRLPEKEKDELIRAATTVEGFMDYISPYLREKVNQLPQSFGIAGKEIFKALESKRLADLEATLYRLREGLHFYIDYEFLRNVYKEIKIIETGGDLIEKARKTYNEGSVFELGDVFKEFSRRYPD